MTPALSLPFRPCAWRLPTPSLLLLPPRRHFEHVELHLPTRQLPSPNAPLLRVCASRLPSHQHWPFSAPPLNSASLIARHSTTSSHPATRLSRQLSLPGVPLQAGAHPQS